MSIETELEHLQAQIRALVATWEEIVEFDFDNGNNYAAASIETCAQQLSALLSEPKP